MAVNLWSVGDDDNDGVGVDGGKDWCSDCECVVSWNVSEFELTNKI